MRLYLALLIVASMLRTAPVGRILDALTSVKEKNGYWLARCPAHEDTHESLSVSAGHDGRALVKCHAGCKYEAIRDALRFKDSDFFVDTPKPFNGASSSSNGADPKNRPYLAKTYDYTDEHGALLYQACRFEPKDFKQRRPDGNGGWSYSLGDTRRVLYRLPEVLEAVAAQRTVFVVEGEKDAETLAAEGYIATTWAGGAKAWREEYTPTFADASVVCLPDNDDPGKSCMQQVAASLTAIGARVRVVELPGLPPKGDVTDWLSTGRDLDELDEIVDKAPAWHPDGSRRVCWRLDELLENADIMRAPPIVIPRIAWEGRSTLLTAREKSGKSTLLGYVAAQVTRGGTFLGDPCAKGSVLLVGLEEFVGDAARRLRHFGADATRMHVQIGFLGDPQARPRELAERIAVLKPTLVIIDSLAAYSRGQIQDDNNATQMTAVLQPLSDLSHEQGVALMISHHARKSDGRSRGSTAITAATDVVCEVFTPDEDTDPTLRRMRSAGRVPLVPMFDFRFDGDTYELAGTSQAPLEQRVTAYVQNHPKTNSNDLCSALAVRKQDANRVILDLLSRGVLLDSGNRKGYALVLAASVAPSLL